MFRVPIRWEAMQPTLTEPISPDALSKLDDFLALFPKGATIIVDLHDYMRRQTQAGYEVVGAPGSTVGVDDLASFWASLAGHLGQKEGVWYGLMNEPHDMPSRLVADNQNAAIRAIRKTGSKARILVCGNNWSGAHAWLSAENGTEMLRINDTLKNFAFDMHQYLDPGYGGSLDTVVPDAGKRSLIAATDWLRSNDKRGFLGEFGTSSDPTSLNELNDQLAFLYDNRDVWLGATYWAGGGSWGRNNTHTTDPSNNQQTEIKPQLAAILRYR